MSTPTPAPPTSPPLPTTQKAVLYHSPHKIRLTHTHLLPTLHPTYLLIHTHSIALNPADHKHLNPTSHPGSLIGFDYSGTVFAVGSEVTKDWKRGDRICGFTHGNDRLEKGNGAFAEWIVVKGDVGIRVPGAWGWEEACTVGVGCGVVGLGLRDLGLPLPVEGEGDGGGEGEEDGGEKRFVLVYGGSTASGALGIQFVKLCGYVPITTCSPKNFDYVRSLGAAAVFDYNDPECGAQIREYTQNTLRLVLDTVSLPSSAKIAAEALSSNGSLDLKYCSLLPLFDIPRKDVKVSFVNGITCLGEYFEYPLEEGPWPVEAVPEDFEFAKVWSGIAERAFAAGKVVPHRMRVCEGGLSGVADGLKMLEEGRVSGEKLVYRVGDTP
ncbi:MAG: hypothetical protein M1834_003290 [Cirrosporium novae-zelandiae]|nr:MAG: hypothetical protein M1834_003290 [Cirrosporium novae-zelandiae]